MKSTDVSGNPTSGRCYTTPEGKIDNVETDTSELMIGEEEEGLGEGGGNNCVSKMGRKYIPTKADLIIISLY